MKTILTEVLVDMAKAINPKTQNLLNKYDGSTLTDDGEKVVNTTIAIMSKHHSDDVVVGTNKVEDYKRPNINVFALMDFSHRVGYTVDKAKSGNYIIEVGADFTFDAEKLISPSVYAEKLDTFLEKCGYKESCDTVVSKHIRTWADVSYLLPEVDVLDKDSKTGKYVTVKKETLMVIDGSNETTKGLLEAQLLKLRPTFNVELFADFTKKTVLHEDIVLWAKQSSSSNKDN